MAFLFRLQIELTMGKKEQRFFATLQAMGLRIDRKPRLEWLTNKIPGLEQEGCQNTLVRIFRELGGDPIGMQEKRKVHLKPDAYLPDYNCILEFDELQHFTFERQKTLLLYQNGVDVGYDLTAYIKLCEESSRLAYAEKRKGFSKPVPEFPFEHGRDCQRALFDSMRDILALENGLKPTMRVSLFEVPSIGSDARGAAEKIAGQVRIALKNRGVYLAT